MSKQQEYKTESINNTKYTVSKNEIKSIYAPYRDFSNCEEVVFRLRTTSKKGVIEREIFNDLSGNNQIFERKDKVFVEDKNRILFLIQKINEILESNDNNTDEIDNLVVEIFDEIQTFYNHGVA